MFQGKTDYTEMISRVLKFLTRGICFEKEKRKMYIIYKIVEKIFSRIIRKK